MKPHKIIDARKPSQLAYCTRMLGNWLVGYHCGADMYLVVTRNPIGGLPYDFLIIERCGAGHIATSQGVVGCTLDDSTDCGIQGEGV